MSLLEKYKSGFIRGDSTGNQVVNIYDICKAMDEDKEVRVVFCDLSKAFDRLRHKDLLIKSEHLGVQESLLKWFKSY